MRARREDGDIDKQRQDEQENANDAECADDRRVAFRIIVEGDGDIAIGCAGRGEISADGGGEERPTADFHFRADGGVVDLRKVEEEAEQASCAESDHDAVKFQSFVLSGSDLLVFFFQQTLFSFFFICHNKLLFCNVIK